jgi:integrase/recombinase XerD
MTITEAINRYQLYLKANRRLGTIAYYQFYLHKLNVYLGHQEIETLTAHDVTLMLQMIKDNHPKIKHVTMNKYIVTLKTVYKYVLDKEFMYKKLKEQKTIIPILNDHDIETVFRYYKQVPPSFQNHRNQLLFHLLLDTGLRINELLHVKKKNIMFTEHMMLVQETKTSVDRYVFFTDETSTLLSNYVKRYNIADFLLIDPLTHQPLCVSSIETIVHRLKKTLNIQKSLSPHKWRHTFATNFLKKGGSLESLRLILGHAHLNTTQKYLHLSKEHLASEYRNIMMKDQTK